jgi:hypothetical protein
MRNVIGKNCRTVRSGSSERWLYSRGFSSSAGPTEDRVVPYRDDVSATASFSAGRKSGTGLVFEKWSPIDAVLADPLCDVEQSQLSYSKS